MQHGQVRGKHGQGKLIPRVAADYFFLNDEDKEKGVNPMLVMKEEDAGEAYARMVAHKGLGEGNEGEWIVMDAIEELKSWGHQGGEGGHVILKSDGERAICAVLDEIARRLGGKVIVERPPKGEFQSNVAAEEAGKRVREMAKVIKDMVEYRTKAKMKLESNIMQWLVR